MKLCGFLLFLFVCVEKFGGGVGVVPAGKKLRGSLQKAKQNSAHSHEQEQIPQLTNTYTHTHAYTIHTYVLPHHRRKKDCRN